MGDVLDQAFASTHMQIFSSISNLQRRLLLIQSGITDTNCSIQIGSQIVDQTCAPKNSVF